LSVKAYRLEALEIIRNIREGNLSITDVIEDFLERVERVEKKINAFITLRSKDELLQEAKIKDRLLKEGKARGRLLGLPIAIKDNISTKNLRTTCGSKILYNYIPPYDATVVKLLKEEGAIILGKTNMDEFAMGSSTETSFFGPTRNPWDLERVPGGSSGGSAAALASGEAPLALGSDTGGSVRAPASFTATVGLKPTYGLVSRYGLIAYANSLEQIGPMGRTVRDVALLLNVISKYDPYDGTSLKVKRPDYLESISKFNNLHRRVKIAVVREMFEEGVSREVVTIVGNVVNKLVDEGFIVDEISIPVIKYALPTYYIIAMSEASSNLARYDGVRYGFRANVHGDWNEVFSETRGNGFGKEVKRRIIMGTFTLSAGYFDQYYFKALKVRTLIIKEFKKAFEKYSILISPTMPTPPFKLGEKIADPLAMYMSDIETVTANIVGIPAISIPAGFAKEKLPVGIQLMANYLKEDLLLAMAAFIEELTGLKNLIAEV